MLSLGWRDCSWWQGAPPQWDQTPGCARDGLPHNWPASPWWALCEDTSHDQWLLQEWQGDQGEVWWWLLPYWRHLWSWSSQIGSGLSTGRELKLAQGEFASPEQLEVRMDLSEVVLLLCIFGKRTHTKNPQIHFCITQFLLWRSKEYLPIYTMHIHACHVMYTCTYRVYCTCTHNSIMHVIHVTCPCRTCTPAVAHWSVRYTSMATVSRAT